MPLIIYWIGWDDIMNQIEVNKILIMRTTSLVNTKLNQLLELKYINIPCYLILFSFIFRNRALIARYLIIYLGYGIKFNF